MRRRVGRGRPVRRPVVGVSTALAVVLMTSWLAACGDGSNGDAGEAGGPPNVVVVTVDDAWAGTLDYMPRTRELVVEPGTDFPNAFVSHTMCCPSRAIFLSGQYPHNNGVWSNNPDSLDEPNGGFPALDGDNTLAVWLEESGYTTAHVGKYLNGYGVPLYGSEPTEIPPGWTEWYGLTDPFTYSYTDFRINENGELICYGHPDTECDGQGESDYSTDRLAEISTAFVEAHAGDEAPFFLSVNPLAPHVDRGFFVVPADRHLGMLAGEEMPDSPAVDEVDVSDKPSFIRNAPRRSDSDRRIARLQWRTSLESLLAVDELVDDLVSALDAAGVLDDTLIVYTSDNGRGFGHHRLATSKYSLYEEALRVPLAIRGPGFPEGSVVDTIVGNVDLAATIAAAAGASPTHPLDGIDLVELAASPESGADRALLVETGEAENTWMSEGYWSVGVRVAGFVYLEDTTPVGTEYELYDLEADPDQLENVADDPDYADVRADLASRLDRLRGCSGDDCR